jgi:hypothetical protein
VGPRQHNPAARAQVRPPAAIATAARRHGGHAGVHGRLHRIPARASDGQSEPQAPAPHGRSGRGVPPRCRAGNGTCSHEWGKKPDRAMPAAQKDTLAPWAFRLSRTGACHATGQAARHRAALPCPAPRNPAALTLPACLCPPIRRTLPRSRGTPHQPARHVTPGPVPSADPAARTATAGTVASEAWAVAASPGQASHTAPATTRPGQRHPSPASSRCGPTALGTARPLMGPTTRQGERAAPRRPGQVPGTCIRRRPGGRRSGGGRSMAIRRCLASLIRCIHPASSRHGTGYPCGRHGSVFPAPGMLARLPRPNRATRSSPSVTLRQTLPPPRPGPRSTATPPRGPRAARATTGGHMPRTPPRPRSAGQLAGRALAGPRLPRLRPLLPRTAPQAARQRLRTPQAGQTASPAPPAPPPEPALTYSRPGPPPADGGPLAPAPAQPRPARTRPAGQPGAAAAGAARS